MALAYAIASAAEAFHVRPVEIARDLENDAADLTFRCLALLHYRDAYKAFTSADKAVLKGWRKTERGRRTIRAVEENERFTQRNPRPESE